MRDLYWEIIKPYYYLLKSKLSATVFLASLLGIPEQNPSINALVQSLTKNHLYTQNSTFDPIAQNAYNPFITSGFKQEIIEPDPIPSRSSDTSTDFSDEIDT